MQLKLPAKGRPCGVRYRQCDLGTDLPSQFIDDLRSIDKDFFPIFHPYRVLWDDMVNEYTGKLNDPRYPIAENSFLAGELVMGHVLSNGQGVPTPDGTWHIWRWCEPARSWAHIINVDCRDRLYLNLLVERIWLQAQYNDRFGHKGYQRMMEQADLAKREKLQNDKADLMGEIHKANSGMLNRAMRNYEHGRVEATRPTKDIIMSGGGLSKRSKITREISDREGGIILPPGMSED
jgi:hypothetical protein